MRTIIFLFVVTWWTLGYTFSWLVTLSITVISWRTNFHTPCCHIRSHPRVQLINLLKVKFNWAFLETCIVSKPPIFFSLKKISWTWVLDAFLWWLVPKIFINAAFTTVIKKILIGVWIILTHSHQTRAWTFDVVTALKALRDVDYCQN